MGEYWNLFLNWLNNGGGMLYISPTTIPTESDAARIYNGGRIADHVELGFPIGHSTEGFEAPPTGKTYGGDKLNPSKIIRYVREPGDTLYKYYPEQRGSYGFKYIVPKAASTKMQNGDDYEKLKKVYKAAESQIKPGYKNGKLPRYVDGTEEFVDDPTLDFIINHEGFRPDFMGRDLVTGTPYIGSGIEIPEYINRFRQTGKWSAEDNRNAVRDIVLANRAGIRRTFGDTYNTLTDALRLVLDDIAYNIGVGKLNSTYSPKFVQAVLSGDMEEAKRQMDWGNHQAKGLVNRNKDRQRLWGGTSLPNPKEIKNNTTLSNSGYLIQRGDSLWKIAKLYTGDGMKYKEIAKLNNIQNPNLIYAGKNLIIPDNWKKLPAKKPQQKQNTNDPYKEVFEKLVVTPPKNRSNKTQPARIVTPEQEEYIRKNLPVIKPVKRNSGGIFGWSSK